MKPSHFVLGMLLCVPALAAAQVIADFEKNLGGYSVLGSQYFGTALTSIAQKADPAGKSAGVMMLRFNFPPGNAGDKGAVGTSSAIVTNGAHFITYWVYIPPSMPDSMEVMVFAQDNQAFSFQQSLYRARDIPRNTWYPISLDLTQAQIRTPAFNLTTGSIFLTGIQVDNYAGNTVWQDSMFVDNVALVGAQPTSVANFETGLGGFADVAFGPALKKVVQVPDPTGKSTGVMQTSWVFPADTASKGAVGLKASGGLAANGARFITFWVYLPDSTMPDSMAVDIFAQDNKNYAWHDTSLLGRYIPKRTWYPVSLDLAQAAAADSRFDLTASNIFVTGVQVHTYAYAAKHPGWTDSIYVDNVQLLSVAVPPPVKKLVLADFSTPGDAGGFAVQSFGPAFTAVANGVDTTNAANRVLVVTAAFDTGAAVKGAMSRSNLTFFKTGDTSATDITLDVYIPPTMPDSAHVDLALLGTATGNAWVQDEHVLGVDFQKGMWNTLDFSVKNHIANGTITNARASATFYVQVYYVSAKKWSGKIFFDNLTLLGIDALTSVTVNSASPYRYRLEHNYPNPFNPSTTIRYELRWDGPVSLTVYDILGREVTTLVNGRQSAGPHAVVFDARGISSGAYFYTLRSGSYTKTEKMLLLK